MHDRRKTLVILTPGFPANEADTTCLPAHQAFIKSLNKTFPSLKIIIVSFRYPFFKKSYQWHGNTVYPFDGEHANVIFRPFFWYKIWLQLIKIKNQNSIAGLFSFWLSDCAVMGKYFGKKFSLPHYGWVTGQDAKPRNRYVKIFHPKSNELVAMSDFLANEFHKNYGVQPFQVIPNGIYTGSFPHKRPGKDIDILAAGSLIPLKQYDILIEVVKAITKSMQPLQAVLCGKGPEEVRLKSMINELELQKTVLLTCEKSHREVLQLMQRSKIFLHTSSFEGFSTVCLEALYAGCHVISFIQPMHHQITHWHIVPTKEEMIQKTLSLLNDASTSYEQVLPYSMDDTARSVMQLFHYKEEATS